MKRDADCNRDNGIQYHQYQDFFTFGPHLPVVEQGSVSPAYQSGKQEKEPETGRKVDEVVVKKGITKNKAQHKIRCEQSKTVQKTEPGLGCDFLILLQ